MQNSMYKSLNYWTLKALEMMSLFVEAEYHDALYSKFEH